MTEVKGFKLKTIQRFTRDGHRIPVTGVKVDSVEGFQPGDLVTVTGWAKGKGFTGVVKRWNFKGGPKTHGQSDRHRAPGSIGQTTTPGRVHKGKKMPGRSGGQKVTLSGLVLMEIEEKEKLFFIKGLLPGSNNGNLLVKKTGEFKKFVPLMKVGETEIKETEEEKEERLRKEKEAEEKLKELAEKKEAEGEKESLESSEGQTVQKNKEEKENAES
jgi:hypothetical protein